MREIGRLRALYADAVVLIPGLLGFGRFGDFNYFADRATACLRSIMEGALGRPVPVVGVAMDPAGPLRGRQRTLLRQLAKVRTTLGHDHLRLHLVGHSTGGLDAELLTHDRPIERDKTWATLDPTGVRTRIASITTLCAPFSGTDIASSGVIRLLGRGDFDLGSLLDAPEAILFLVHVASAGLNRASLVDLVQGAVANPAEGLRFLKECVRTRELFHDLDPVAMSELRRRSTRVLPVPIACFAAAAPQQPILVADRPREPDRFFHRLSELVREGVVGNPTFDDALALLHNVPCIGNPAARALPFAGGLGAPSRLDATLNDGVVPTGRQVLVDTPATDVPAATVEALVVADHGDVIGRYDRQDPYSVGLNGDVLPPINKGFFRSGAGFGDDEFFELYRRMGQRVLQAIPLD